MHTNRVVAVILCTCLPLSCAYLCVSVLSCGFLPGHCDTSFPSFEKHFWECRLKSSFLMWLQFLQSVFGEAFAPFHPCVVLGNQCGYASQKRTAVSFLYLYANITVGAENKSTNLREK